MGLHGLRFEFFEVARAIAGHRILTPEMPRTWWFV